MKIYIAAKYAKRYELRPVVEQLRAMGHECTSQWIDNGEESKGQRAAALMDLADVDRADMVIFLAEHHRSQNIGGGRWFEFGYAFAKEKKIIVVQPGEAFETVFCALPYVTPVASIADALAFIGQAPAAWQARQEARGEWSAYEGLAYRKGPFASEQATNDWIAANAVT